MDDQEQERLDKFAMAAMQMVIYDWVDNCDSGVRYDNETNQSIAEDAYNIAEAMVKESDRRRYPPVEDVFGTIAEQK